MKSTNRETYLDVLRILANFLVLFNHTAGYVLYQHAEKIPTFVAYTAISLFTRINIPLFFMITGVLLLGKEEPIGVVLKKRVLRFAALLLIATTCIYFVSTPLSEFHLQTWLDAYFNRSIEGSYWYLYTYLAFLIMLPYIRKIAKNFTEKDFIYFITIHCVVTTIVPFIDYFVYLNTGNHFNVFPELIALIMVYQSFFYPIIGHYLDKNVDMSKFNLQKLLPLYGVCAIGIGVVSWLTYDQGINFGYTEDFFKMFDYVLAITVFLTTKYLLAKNKASKKRSWINTMITAIAQLTLGIYILDPFLKIFLPPVERFISPNTPTLFVAFAWCIVSMIIGGLVTFVLRLVPGVKKIL